MNQIHLMVGLALQSLITLVFFIAEGRIKVNGLLVVSSLKINSYPGTFLELSFIL